MKQQSIKRTLNRLVELAIKGNSGPIGFGNGFGTFLMVLSGLIIYLHTTPLAPMIHERVPQEWLAYYQNPRSWLWACCQTLAPLLFVVATLLKPMIISYFVVLYCYMLQFYFFLIDSSFVDNHYAPFYTLGICVVLFGLIIWLRHHHRIKAEIRLQGAKRDLLHLIGKDDEV